MTQSDQLAPQTLEPAVKRTVLVPVAALAVVALAGTASAQTLGVETVVTGTTTAGTLAIAGVGATAALSGTPGAFASGAGTTALTVTDATGSARGWAVTATYSAVSGTTDVGGANVLVSTSGVTADALGGLDASKVTVATDAPLTTPVTVASTGSNAGSGITTMTSSYKVRIPVTAQVGDVFGGKVTYTVASVR